MNGCIDARSLALRKNAPPLPVLFQISAYLQAMWLQVAELLVDRRWSSGLSGSGTVEG